MNIFMMVICIAKLFLSSSTKEKLFYDWNYLKEISKLLFVIVCVIVNYIFYLLLTSTKIDLKRS